MGDLQTMNIHDHIQTADELFVKWFPVAVGVATFGWGFTALLGVPPVNPLLAMMAGTLLTLFSLAYHE